MGQPRKFTLEVEVADDTIKAVSLWASDEGEFIEDVTDEQIRDFCLTGIENLVEYYLEMEKEES